MNEALVWVWRILLLVMVMSLDGQIRILRQEKQT